MKTDSLILLAAVAIGGYFLYKMFGEQGAMGGGGGPGLTLLGGETIFGPERTGIAAGRGYATRLIVPQQAIVGGGGDVPGGGPAYMVNPSTYIVPVRATIPARTGQNFPTVIYAPSVTKIPYVAPKAAAPLKITNIFGFPVVPHLQRP
ncbi:MAG: hypothetical protein IMZ61_02980 [Planctomycetes bacterium]|nr:hypothetical protein [Planctomycetota bacterium]